MRKNGLTGGTGWDGSVRKNLDVPRNAWVQEAVMSKVLPIVVAGELKYFTTF